jgi:M6 family metalloprotease-like protein
MKMKICAIFLFVLSFILIFHVSSNAQGMYCFNPDSLPQPLLESQLLTTDDTVGLVLIFYVDGCTSQNCRYDSVDFRQVRRVLPTYGRDLADTTLPYSMVNYYKNISSGKHNIKGIVLPLGDSAYECDSIGLGSGLPKDIIRIINQADQDIDFGMFDLTGENGQPDGFVDMVGFICLNRFGTGGNSVPHMEGNPCRTTDLNIYGDTVKIREGNIFSIMVWNYNDQNPDSCTDSVKTAYGRLSQLCEHEYGHHFGYADLDHLGNTVYNHDALGGFCLMDLGGGFIDRVSPPNPWYRHSFIGINGIHKQMDWTKPISVEDAPLYNKEIPYSLSSDSAAYMLKNTSVNTTQSFYITAHHRFGSYFESTWPTPDNETRNGLLIWHVDADTSIDRGIFYNYLRNHKAVDLEVARGLYDWTGLVMDTTSPNPIMGLDSLDVHDAYPFYFPMGNRGSKNTFFDGSTYTNFDDFSNPSSKFCKSTSNDSQTVISHLAVRHIHPHNGKIYADLLVNNYYGQLDSSMTWGHATIHKGYAITGDITVSAGETLRILPGTDIYFQTHEDNQLGGPALSHCALEVYGTLIAEGTAENPIRFISSSSQYDSGAAGDWYGIRILSGGKASLNYTEIKYAYNAISAYGPESLGISNSTISYSENCGIYAEGTSFASLNIIGVDFSHPGAKGIDLKNACANLEDVHVDKPTTYGIYYINDLGTNPAPFNPKDTLNFDLVEVHGTGNTSGNTSIGIQMSSANYPFLTNMTSLTIDSCYGRGLSLTNADSNSVISAFAIHHIGDKGIYVANSKLRIETPGGQECWYGWGIWDCFHGIYCYGYNAKPKIRKVEITNISSVAVYNAYGLPYLGKRGDSYGCYNQIMIDTSKYDIYNYGGDSILAQENWWGENPPRIKAYGKYKISNSLTSRPCGPVPKIAGELMPDEFSLAQNYPNPFNSSTTINFTLPSDQFVTLDIFNLLGQKVKTLVSQNMPAGPNQAIWHGDDSEGNSVASGIYLYLLRTDDYSAAKQMLMLR